MSAEETGSLARVEELTEAECRALLATKRVGRVAHNDPEGPVVVPVNYVFEDGMVLFRISPYSALADKLGDGAASFQVDHVDEDARTGWSVLVRGHAVTGEGLGAARGGHPSDTLGRGPPQPPCPAEPPSPQRRSARRAVRPRRGGSERDPLTRSG